MDFPAMDDYSLVKLLVVFGGCGPINQGFAFSIE
jgi:uncharacterized protein YneR